MPLPSLSQPSAHSASTHTPPSSTVPAGHAHVPLTHDWPAVQTFPHDPQLFGLLVELTHPPLQQRNPPEPQPLGKVLSSREGLVQTLAPPGGGSEQLLYVHAFPSSQYGACMSCTPAL